MRRLVVLIHNDEQERLRRLAGRKGQSVASVVRAAIRRATEAEDLLDKDEAVAVLCGEHDAAFSWPKVKRDLERRYGK